jgi:SAM-dependent methyltransferase
VTIRLGAVITDTLRLLSPSLKDSSVNSPAADFDRFAQTYRQEISDALGVFGSSAEYFAEYKVELTRTKLGREPQSILDFGCGVGESIPHFAKRFRNSEISGFDVSVESINELSSRFPNVTVYSEMEAIKKQFDLVFVSNVLHHIDPRERYERLQDLWNLVSPGGSLFVFEHNPFNPLTQRIVSNCALDEGVVLLSSRELRSLLRISFGPQQTKRGYCLFVPPVLRRLSILERYLDWLPLGGQHYASVTKSN